jgi:hypothetical protein
MTDESRSLGGLKPVENRSQINLGLNCETLLAARDIFNFDKNLGKDHVFCFKDVINVSDDSAGRGRL